MKIVTVLGARPQFIKAGSLSREISKRLDIKEIIIHTGQHYDSNMSEIFFEEMKIPKPDYFLAIKSKYHGEMTGKMLQGIEKTLLKEQPDWVIVYGDTNSTLAGALAATKLHIKIAHIEAGLRSFNNAMPEEINRILTDRVSNLLLCPTAKAIENLKNEGYDKINCKVVNIGDIMLDGAIFYNNFAVRPKFKLNKEYVLCTLHRAENTNHPDRIFSIVNALNEISKRFQVILPLHPRTKKVILEHGIKIDFNIIDPVGYLQMIYFIKHSKTVITDSGGLQKEAFFFNKNCITLRDETEWTELVENNFNYLAGASTEKIVEAFSNHKFNQDFSKKFYGDGKASEKIIKALLEFK